MTDEELWDISYKQSKLYRYDIKISSWRIRMTPKKFILQQYPICRCRDLPLSDKTRERITKTDFKNALLDHNEMIVDFVSKGFMRPSSINKYAVDIIKSVDNLLSMFDKAFYQDNRLNSVRNQNESETNQ